MQKILGFGIIAFGIFLEILWLGVCFGTVIVGIALLIFAPRILFFPFNFFLVIGLAMVAGGSFQSGSNFRYQSYSGSNQAPPNFAQPSNNLAKYYETLESQPTDSMDVIKKNYRRLVKKYHYDSIASKNLPADMLKFAQEKTQSLNEAYNAIKEARG
jgi:hypothetical protein